MKVDCYCYWYSVCVSYWTLSCTCQYHSHHCGILVTVIGSGLLCCCSILIVLCCIADGCCLSIWSIRCWWSVCTPASGIMGIILFLHNAVLMHVSTPFCLYISIGCVIEIFSSEFYWRHLFQETPILESKTESIKFLMESTNISMSLWFLLLLRSSAYHGIVFVYLICYSFSIFL